MLQVLLALWVCLGCAVFLAACAWRAWKYASAPEHLRWDLYPVAHEPRRSYGGSYLEEKDWWKKPRPKSLWGEVSAMAEEILWLKGVRANNRTLWWGSLPFHWGMYFLLATTGGLMVAALGFSPPWLLFLLACSGGAGGALTALGALMLLVLRYTDPKLLPYTVPTDRLNLALLIILGALSTAVAIVPPGMSAVVSAMAALLHARPAAVPLTLGLQMAVASLFILYLPFTRMVHFFSKYFLYHQVRWDDRPVERGSVLQRRLSAALNFGVAWSAPHIQSGKTWAEVATTIPGDEKQKEQ